MNKTTNNYINQLKLDPKKEAAVRKLVENAVDVEAIKEEVLKIPSKFEFVDLGLPSGTKWATCNVGASKPEEAGLYFQWGDTQGWSKEQIENGEKAFSWSDYKFTNDNGSTFTKYNETDGKLVLDLEDDAAYQFDNTCRTPTIAEIKELKNNTDYTLETINGVVGGRLTSQINGNSIFIPRNAYCYDGKVDIGTSGPFWSSSRSEYNNRMSNYGYITEKYLSYDSEERYLGLSIRPVQDASTPSTLVEKVNAIEIKAKEAKEIYDVLSWDFNVDKYNELIKAYKADKIIRIDYFYIMDSWTSYDDAANNKKGKLINCSMSYKTLSENNQNLISRIYKFNEDGTAEYEQCENIFINSGDGTKFLANDGSYKEAGQPPYLWDGTTSETIFNELKEAIENNRRIINKTYNIEYFNNKVYDYGTVVLYSIVNDGGYDCTEITTVTSSEITSKFRNLTDYEYVYGEITNTSINKVIYASTHTFNDTYIEADTKLRCNPNMPGNVGPFIGQFEFGNTVYNMTFVDNYNTPIQWSVDSVLDFKPNHVYQYRIINGYGIMKEFEKRNLPT